MSELRTLRTKSQESHDKRQTDLIFAPLSPGFNPGNRRQSASPLQGELVYFEGSQGWAEPFSHLRGINHPELSCPNVQTKVPQGRLKLEAPRIILALVG